MSPICVAATVSWALLFGADPAGTCFSEQAGCATAAFAANAAFIRAGSKERATCAEQPALPPKCDFTRIYNSNASSAVCTP